tara:strand:+ start:867 stop:1250 length:384 start_codon:yes stop_codon:yes gene_type:complete
MRSTSNEVTIGFLQRFADAWTDHDIDLLMTFMSDNPVFQLSSGPNIDGMKYSGYEDVKQGFKAVLDKFPNGKWVEASHFVAGDRGVSEWTFASTDNQGIESKVRGCDIFTFEHGKISVKNSFRKIII